MYFVKLNESDFRIRTFPKNEKIAVSTHLARTVMLAQYNMLYVMSAK